MLRLDLEACRYGAGIASLTRQQIFDTARQVYTNHDQILRALGF